jgi:hypothetical protein
VTSSMETAREIADAVLYEGYLLYPYRASARKNQSQNRWQFGVLVPPSYAAAGHGEHSSSLTQCLVEPAAGTVLHLRMRFLQLQHRSGGTGAVPEYDEAVEREVDAVVHLDDVLDTQHDIPVELAGGVDTETVDGSEVCRERWELHGVLRLSARVLPGPYGVVELTVEMINASGWDEPGADRNAALRRSLIAAHTLIAVTDGQFVPLLDPPEWARPAAAACRTERAWPVMVGAEGSCDMLLLTPIILSDYPSIAPESAGELFDGTENDELLTLRTMVLTDEEKAEARATDERARELLDRVDSMPGEMLERLHGVVRYMEGVTGGTKREPDSVGTITTPGAPWWDPGADASVDPDTDSVMVDGVAVAKGSQVVLRPGRRRADAQDMFLAGHTATVAAVLLDVDGETHVAVTLDDDPGTDMAIAHGRFRYFAPDEIEPLS